MVTGSVDEWLKQLKQCKYLNFEDAKELAELVEPILSDEPNILNLSAPISLVGDIHGQFFDLLEIFTINGDPPFTSYLFLGDYVDRGLHSVETLQLLLCLKLKYPRNVYLIRGNHETRQITQVYGFYDECLRKYGNAFMWRIYTNLFDTLPLAAFVDEEIFCVHGGLSPNISNVDTISTINRHCEVPCSGPMSDLLWSDPSTFSQGYSVNPRGAGYIFGEDTVKEFNHHNKISLICRAHQLVMEGFQVIFDGQLCTVWSAPNYCYRCGNIASIMNIFDKDNYKFKTFVAAPVINEKMIRVPLPEYFL